jgi:DNA-binding LytR/AlgR family response regulator
MIEERLKITTSIEHYRIPTEDIAFIKADGNYCDVHLFNGEKLTLTFQLHYFEEQLGRLKNNFFIRVGKSLIVNRNYILSVNTSMQTLYLMNHRMNSLIILEKVSKEPLKELKTKLEHDD